MRLFSLALLLAPVLASCAQDTIEAQRSREDDIKCRLYGLTPVDPGYPQCRIAFELQRRRQQQNALYVLQMSGVYLLPQAAPLYPWPQAAPPPPVQPDAPQPAAPPAAEDAPPTGAPDVSK